ncbi:MAG: hypothetical protein ACKVU4_08355 [Phycisphaerales bacterium]
MTRRMIVMAAGSLLAATAANAQNYTSGFEAPTYTGSAAGTTITGTDGWYVPVVVNSTDGKAYTYAGNALGFPANPNGSDQFQAGTGTAPSLLSRSQHDVNFAAGGVWQVQYDFAGKWSGPAVTPGPPAVVAVDNIGSWSTQDSTISRGFQSLMTWGSTVVGPVPNATLYTATADKFHHAIGYYATAAATAITAESPSPAWRDLLVNNWYRVRIKWDFNTARILECSIQDITGGGAIQVTDVSANPWYLRGGPNSTLPLPTAMRLFGGGAVAAGLANSCAFDNISIKRICYPDCNESRTLTVADFGCFQGKYVLGDMYADCNASGTLTVADFGCFQGKYVLGCP